MDLVEVLGGTCRCSSSEALVRFGRALLHPSFMVSTYEPSATKRTSLIASTADHPNLAPSIR